MSERLLQSGLPADAQRRGLNAPPQQSIDSRTQRQGPFEKLKEAWSKRKGTNSGTAYGEVNLGSPQSYLPDREQELQPPDVIRPMRPEDVQTMIDDGWFEDKDRIKGLRGDVINDNTLPEKWNDETRAKFRDDVLMPFYFPDGPVHIVAKDDKGRLIREVDVNRQTMVLDWKGKLVATRSFIDKDPWARESEYNKYKIAHAQMLLVAPGQHEKGFGNAIAIAVEKEVFEAQGFQMLVTWITTEGKGYDAKEQFFLKHGYREDRVITIDGVRMRRYELRRRNRVENLASDNDPRRKWDEKKLKLQREEAAGNL